MLVLAFDTATDVASTALVRVDDGGRVLVERRSSAVRLLADVEAMLAEAGLGPRDVEALAVGRGPGRYTSLRMGLATARALAFSLGVEVAGVSTLEALSAGAAGAVPVIDARRGEVFTLSGEPVCIRPEAIRLQPGTVCVGDGAVRHRETLEALGGVVPPDGDERHAVRARFLALLAADFGPAERAEPIYLRAPDADRALERRAVAGR